MDTVTRGAAIATPAAEDGSDPWTLHVPLPLLPSRGHQYPPKPDYVMEKNWMPFVHRVGREARKCGSAAEKPGGGGVGGR